MNIFMTFSHLDQRLAARRAFPEDMKVCSHDIMATFSTIWTIFKFNFEVPILGVCTACMFQKIQVRHALNPVLLHAYNGSLLHALPLSACTINRKCTISEPL